MLSFKVVSESRDWSDLLIAHCGQMSTSPEHGLCWTPTRGDGVWKGGSGRGWIRGDPMTGGRGLRKGQRLLCPTGGASKRTDKTAVSGKQSLARHRSTGPSPWTSSLESWRNQCLLLISHPVCGPTAQTLRHDSTPYAGTGRGWPCKFSTNIYGRERGRETLGLSTSGNTTDTCSCEEPGA